MEHVLQKIQGETRREEKRRFKEALAEVAPFMDHVYAPATHRKFPNRTLAQIRVVRQRGLVDWDVLAYWFEEFMPEAVAA